MQMEEAKLISLLQKTNYLSQEDAKRAQAYAKEQRLSFADAVVTGGFMTKDLLGQALAEFYGIPYADLNSYRPSQEQVLAIPEEVAKKWRLVVFRIQKKGVTVATDNPKRRGLSAVLKKLFPDVAYTLAFSVPEDIDEAFVFYKKSLDTRFSKILEESSRVAPEILDEIFEDAFTLRASDIHFEPMRKDVLVRFRIDGILQEAGRLEKSLYENILNRIKVQSRLRIDEHFSAQDGSMRFEKENRVFDVRTSVVPTVEGEKVVLRVLSAYVRGLSFADLGLDGRHQKLLAAAVQKPFGMILVSGPTGSGKTTSLYTVLKRIQKPEVNITTIEDPVEYKMEGVNQIQVNPEADLSFSKGLRSIVRQDPDVILVGEIRDEETAEIAVNAALTGHLLLSTFHANNAATVIPRLLDMNVEPFLIASTLEVIVAQRLLRKICESCRVSQSFSAKELKERYPSVASYFGRGKTTLYEGRGCAACQDTGFKGRTGIFEMIEISSELKDLIVQSPSDQEIWKLARSQGAISLFEDGLQKVRLGVTTLEELFRVATPRP